MSGGTPPAPVHERMVPTLNAFSASIQNLQRIYQDGSQGKPMLLDGDWQNFATVKNRFVDKCVSFNIEDYRSTNNKPGDLTSDEGKLWTMVQAKLYDATRGLMTDELADFYRDEHGAHAATHRVLLIECTS